MCDWETVARRVVLDTGPYLKVELHRVRLPDGRVIEDWPWVVTPDFVIIVAITEDDRFVCFRQTKYSVQGVSLAPVGGYIDDDEPPLTGAKRELLEETGYEARHWELLGDFPVDGNRGAGAAHLFLARDIVRVAQPHADDLEDQELLFLTRAEVAQALDAGEFKVLPWVAALALALRRTAL